MGQQFIDKLLMKRVYYEIILLTLLVQSLTKKSKIGDQIKKKTIWHHNKPVNNLWSGWQAWICRSENGFTGLENRFTGLENGFTGLENGFAVLENGFTGVENGFAYLENGFTGFVRKRICLFRKRNESRAGSWCRCWGNTVKWANPTT
jgi:hypothetical protein